MSRISSYGLALRNLFIGGTVLGISILILLQLQPPFDAAPPPDNTLQPTMTETLLPAAPEATVLPLTSLPTAVNLGDTPLLPSATPEPPVIHLLPSPTPVDPTATVDSLLQQTCQATPRTAEELTAAITAGNTWSSSYTICLAADTTYILTSAANDFYGPTGLPAIKGQITIEGNNAAIIRDVNAPPFRLMAVDSGGRLTLRDLTLKSGFIDVNAGAALVLYFGTADLSHVNFLNNRASHPVDGHGGAIYNYASTLSVANSVFQDNESAVSAGAVFSWSGTSTIANSCFYYNPAADGFLAAQRDGGSVWIYESWFIEEATTRMVGSGVTVTNPLVPPSSECDTSRATVTLAPVPPVLQSPAKDETITADPDTFPLVTLRWDWGNTEAPITGPLAYDVTIGLSEDTTTLTTSAAGLKEPVFVTPPLASGTYYVRLRSTNAIGMSSEWSVSTFTVDSGSGPATLTPVFTPIPTFTPPPASLRVISFTLIDNATNMPLRTMIEGETLDLTTLPPGLRIRADVEGTPGNVIFDLNDEKAYSEDAYYEFRLTASWDPIPGDYTLTATPYTSPYNGIAGTPLTIHFRVVGSSISDLTLSNDKVYAQGVLQVGATVYKDRWYTFTHVAPTLLNSEFIQTVNNDKETTGEDFMTFTLSCAATVYIGYDSRLMEPPWLNDWRRTSLMLAAVDGSNMPLARVVYRKHFKAGTVTLGANYGIPNSNMYTVIVKEDKACDDHQRP